MQIQLTQDELKDAVRQYVAKDFNLEGRTLTISFTATRGDAGVITNLSISKDGDVVIPGFTNSAPDTAAPVAAAVAPATIGSNDFTAETKTTAALAAVAPVVTTDTPTAAAAEAKVEAPEAPSSEGGTAEAAPAATAAPTTTSLFG